MAEKKPAKKAAQTSAKRTTAPPRDPRIHGRRTSGDEGSYSRIEGGGQGQQEQSGWGTRSARFDRRDAGTRSRHGQAAPRAYHATAPVLWPKTWYGMPAYAKDGKVVVFLPKRGQVQGEVCDARLQRRGEPRYRRDVADLFRAEEIDLHRRGEDPHAPEEGGQLRTEGSDDGRRLHARDRSVPRVGESARHRRWGTYTPHRGGTETGCAAWRSIAMRDPT